MPRAYVDLIFYSSSFLQPGARTHEGRARAVIYARCHVFATVRVDAHVPHKRTKYKRVYVRRA